MTNDLDDFDDLSGVSRKDIENEAKEVNTNKEIRNDFFTEL